MYQIHCVTSLPPASTTFAIFAKRSCTLALVMTMFSSVGCVNSFGFWGALRWWFRGFFSPLFEFLSPLSGDVDFSSCCGDEPLPCPTRPLPIFFVELFVTVKYILKLTWAIAHYEENPYFLLHFTLRISLPAVVSVVTWTVMFFKSPRSLPFGEVLLLFWGRRGPRFGCCWPFDSPLPLLSAAERFSRNPCGFNGLFCGDWGDWPSTGAMLLCLGELLLLWCGRGRCWLLFGRGGLSPVSPEASCWFWLALRGGLGPRLRFCWPLLLFWFFGLCCCDGWSDFSSSPSSLPASLMSSRKKFTGSGGISSENSERGGGLRSAKIHTCERHEMRMAAQQKLVK